MNVIKKKNTHNIKEKYVVLYLWTPVFVLKMSINTNTSVDAVQSKTQNLGVITFIWVC
jgi:shikimate kinase